MKTIEEKAKAYDEIIERAKTMLSAGEVMYGKENNASQLITDIIPDLKESEDEKIYREIYSIVHHYYERKADLLVSSRDKNEMLEKWEKTKSFLEKQKGQKERDDKELSEKIASAYQLGLADKEKQMMKGAVEGVIRGDNAKLWVCNNPPSFIFDKFKDGDKVKLIIKED